MNRAVLEWKEILGRPFEFIHEFSIHVVFDISFENPTVQRSEISSRVPLEFRIEGFMNYSKSRFASKRYAHQTSHRSDLSLRKSVCSVKWIYPNHRVFLVEDQSFFFMIHHFQLSGRIAESLFVVVRQQFLGDQLLV